MSTYQTVRNVGLLLLPIAAFSLMQLSASAQNSTASLDFSTGGVVVNGVASYSMNRCRLENLGDTNHHLRMFAGDKFSFLVKFSATPQQVVIKIEYLFSEDPSKLAPKIKPPPKSAADRTLGKKAPLSLYVNGELARSWEKFPGSYQAAEIAITNLKEGANTFELRYADESGTSSCWVKNIRI